MAFQPEISISHKKTLVRPILSPLCPVYLGELQQDNFYDEWECIKAFYLPLGHDSGGVVKKRADLFATRSQFTGSGQVNGRYLSHSGCKMYEEVKNYTTAKDL